MDNGKEIPVSRLRSKEFSGVVLQYMKIYKSFIYGAGNMVEYLDFFNIYIIGLIEGVFQFYS
ncbi:hypothetical protein C823_007485 [Eubacterium plexicaudatum ASF492]|nr:hypothetical protein C823_007485 [Eubacterium plexicaudatum ASF492]